MPENSALTQKAAILCLVTLKPSAGASTASCPLACRISPTAERDRPNSSDGAEHQEAERVPVVDVRVDREHVGHRHADLAAGDAGEDDDEVLQQQHRDQRDQPEIGAAQPQRRHRQQEPADAPPRAAPATTQTGIGRPS